MNDREQVNHGKMRWTEELDIEGYALFRCDQCGRVVGLQPGKPYKMLIQGNFYALHQAWVLPAMGDLWGLEMLDSVSGADLSVPLIDVQMVRTKPDDRSPIH